MAKVKWIPGCIVRIDLGQDQFAFGQLLEFPLIRFFDFRSKLEVPLEKIQASPTAFSIWVMQYAVKDNFWPTIGELPIPSLINQQPPFFKIDSLSGKVFITYTGEDEELADLDAINGLECAAVWDPEHVVDRLNDHFNGVPNRWVQSMRP